MCFSLTNVHENGSGDKARATPNIREDLFSTEMRQL